MERLGIPTIPGSNGNLSTNPEQQLKIANSIGFPVLIKACSGGGGRGMLVVQNPHDLAKSVLKIKSEAKSLFGNDNVYLEKFLINPRHIEVQILADKFGNVLCLGDRDCSIQRRHQKIIEEAPASGIAPTSRRKLYDLCSRAMQKIGYVGVGTIETLYVNGKFYFIEMNTRIQVEHPVTEMVTGIDIIQEQILAHCGQKLSYTQKDIKVAGHSIECRINAEDPETMQPCPGLISNVHLPGGYGVRVDSHIYNGYIVPHNYDSLIAKIIVHGKNRKQAILAMQQALYETENHRNKN